MDSETLRKINISELLRIDDIKESDVMMIENSNNTYKMTILQFKKSILNDDEPPSNYRIYSSEKINNLIEELKKYIEENVTGNNDAINDLEENKASKRYVQDLINELDKVKLELEDLEPINRAIESKRSSNVLITGYDLDTSSDDVKIHIENLGEDVLSALTGNAEVSIPTVPVGGWNNNHLAEHCITADKLGVNYRFRGYITSGSINDIIADGIYLINYEVEDVPSVSDEVRELKLLEVTRFGESGENMKQKIEYLNNRSVRPTFTRIGEVKRIHTVEWVKTYNISDDFKVTTEMIGDQFKNRGIIEDGNLYDYKVEGSYYVKSTVKNLPTDTCDYLVDIDVYDDRYIYTATTSLRNKCIVYKSIVYKDSNSALQVTEWFATNTINRSKFDGSKIHIYGDDISFGYGASSMANTSYPALLHTIYGFDVTNHALSDATIGNYDSEECKERSILTQIENTNSIEDNSIVLIFAGSNDYVLGKGSTLGKDYTYEDSTFKGSLSLAIQNIYKLNNTARIILVTPLYRGRKEMNKFIDSDTYPINDHYLYDYADAIKRIAEINHLPVLDLYYNGGINAFNKEAYLAEDLFFLNDRGHDMVAKKVFDCASIHF